MNGDEADFFVTSAERAYQAIMKRILSGDFAPGTRLVRRQIAEELEMSPIPVLEALKRLEQDGLVEYRAHWGSIVAIPTLERVKDLFALREAVECQVARLLASSATAAQAEALRALAAELDRVRYESEDALLVTDFHYRLHMLMAEFSGYRSLSDTLRKLNFFWLLCRGGQLRRRKAALRRDWHTALIEIILSGDPDAADRAMREHIRDSYVPFIEEFGASA